MTEITQLALRAREAARALARTSTAVRNGALVAARPSRSETNGRKCSLISQRCSARWTSASSCSIA